MLISFTNIQGKKILKMETIIKTSTYLWTAQDGNFEDVLICI